MTRTTSPGRSEVARLPGDHREHIAALADAALELLSRRDFQGARALLECVLAWEGPPPVLATAYAVCLAELGETERAESIARELTAAGGPTAVALRRRAERFLPGGGLAKRRRDEFKADAERWLPRSGRRVNQ
jgi:hypothetical protein